MAYRSARPRQVLLVSLCLVAGLAGTAAAAQDEGLAGLDRVVAQTPDAPSGVALARQLAGSGDLLGALATVERVLMREPGADEARLFRVQLLCRLDDREGARAALAELAGRSVSDEARTEIAAACERLDGPGGGGGRP